MKKKTILMILAVVLLAAAGFGIFRLATHNTANHADRLGAGELQACNTAVTQKAQVSGTIGKQEILILHTLSKTRGMDSDAVFYIYRLPEGADPSDYTGLRISQADASGDLVYMGTLSCRLVENDHTSAYDMKVTYIR